MAKLRFRMKPKAGFHYLRQNRREVTVRPGDVVRCTKEEIHGALDKFEQLDPDPPPPEPKIGLKAVHCGFGKWDVINETTGVKINDKPLTKAEAREIALSLPPDEEEDQTTGESNATPEDK